MKSQEPATSPPTAWHPLFGWVLRAILPKDRSQIHAEFQLNLLPLRNDYVVIQSTPGSPLLSSGPLSTSTLAGSPYWSLRLRPLACAAKTGSTASVLPISFVHQVTGQSHPTFCIETGLVEEPLLRLFSPLFLNDPKAVFDLLTQEERAIFYQVYREIEQFKADPQALSCRPGGFRVGFPNG